jgi:hypothetical protein
METSKAETGSSAIKNSGMFPAESHHFQKLCDPVFLFRSFGEFVDGQPLPHDFLHRHPGVQGGIGILEDDLHLATELAQFLLVRLEDRRLPKIDLPGSRLDKPEDEACDGRFTAPGLPHQPQGLATANLKAHPVHRA